MYSVSDCKLPAVFNTGAGDGLWMTANVPLAGLNDHPSAWQTAHTNTSKGTGCVPFVNMLWSCTQHGAGSVKSREMLPYPNYISSAQDLPSAAACSDSPQMAATLDGFTLV
jgi:hypothetical protein